MEIERNVLALPSVLGWAQYPGDPYDSPTNFLLRCTIVLIALLIFVVVYVRLSQSDFSAFQKKTEQEEHKELKRPAVADPTDPLIMADEAIQLNPTDPDAWVLRAEVKMDIRDFSGAVADFTRGLELGAYGYSPASVDGDDKSKLPDENADRRQLSALFLERGRACLMAGDTVAALDDLKRSIEIDDENTGAMMYMSSAYISTDDMESAAIALAHMQNQAGKIEKDIEAAEKMTGADKTARLGQSYYDRSQLRLAAGDLPGAESDLEQALHQGYAPEDLWIELIFVRRCMNNLDSALETASAAFDYRPPMLPAPDPSANFLARSYVVRSMVLRAKGDNAGAMADLDAMVALNSDASDSRHIRGGVRAYLNDTDGALADYAEAARLDNADADAHLKTALLLRERKDLPNALAAFDRALTRSPRDEVTLLFRSLTRNEAGLHEGAREDMAAAMKLNPRLTHRFLNKPHGTTSQAQI